MFHGARTSICPSRKTDRSYESQERERTEHRRDERNVSSDATCREPHDRGDDRRRKQEDYRQACRAAERLAVLHTDVVQAHAELAIKLPIRKQQDAEDENSGERDQSRDLLRLIEPWGGAGVGRRRRRRGRRTTAVRSSLAGRSDAPSLGPRGVVPAAGPDDVRLWVPIIQFGTVNRLRREHQRPGSLLGCSGWDA